VESVAVGAFQAAVEACIDLHTITLQRTSTVYVWLVQQEREPILGALFPGRLFVTLQNTPKS
jgi:hypothetical protein